MKSLKNILAFVIPLTSMLITFIIYLFTHSVIDDYKDNISNDYSIVIVANTPIIKENFDKLANIEVVRINTLNKNRIIKNIKNDLSKDSLMLLKSKLPFFYKIHLERFPTSTELLQIQKELKSDKNIKSVEIFSKDHNNIYLLLIIINEITLVLFSVILIFTIIILSKQVKIWFYENANQITILQLHGASILYSASKIIKHAMLSALLSFCLASLLVVMMSINISLFIPTELQSILNTQIDIKDQIINLFMLSFGISIFTIFGVLLTYKIKND